MKPTGGGGRVEQGAAGGRGQGYTVFNALKYCAFDGSLWCSQTLK